MKEEKLITLLQKKKGFFESLLDLTESEKHLPFQEWVSTLEQKRVLLSCIDDIDAELQPFKSALHYLSQEVDEELNKIRKVIKQILHLDTLNQVQRKRELQPDFLKNE